MQTKIKYRVAAGAMGLTALAGAGGAVAATQGGSPKADHQAFVNDAAKKLGVSSSKLNSALDAARKENPGPGDPGGRPPGGKDGKHKAPPEAKAAAEYLGMTQAALGKELQGGKTLADVAKEKGKSTAGLEAAIADSIKADAATRAHEIVTHKDGGPGGPGGHGGPPGPPPAGQ
jgi:hypothetical protein